MIRRRRGISPVIAIVILIAVAVALGIAVAFWATGLIGTLGKVEKLEIRTAYAEKNSGGWYIYLTGANTGTADVTVVEITVNGKPLSGNDKAYYETGTTDVTTNSSTWNSTSPPTIKAGQEFGFLVYIHSSGGTLSSVTSGQTIEIALVSGSGTAFKRTVVLP